MDKFQTEDIISDNYWITQNNSLQSKNIKFATFDIPSIDNELQTIVTFEIIEKDINSAIETLIVYEEFYEKLINGNKKEILSIFTSHQLKYFNYKVFAEILRREIILLSHIIKIKQGFEHELLTQKIQKEYLIDGEAFYTIITDVKSMGVVLTEEDKIELKEIVKQAMKYEEELIKTIDIGYKPCLTTLSILMKFIKATVEDGINIIILLLKEHSEKVIIDFFQILIKFEVFITLIPLAIKVKDDDLFNLSEDSEKWIRIKKNYERKIPYHNEKLKPKLRNLFDFLVVGYASVFKGYRMDNKYLKFLLTGYFMTYFFFNKQSASMESKRFSIRPKFETSRTVWNLLDSKVIKHALKGILAGICSIRYRNKLYLKKNEIEITSKYVDQLVSKLYSLNSNNNVNDIFGKKQMKKEIMGGYSVYLENLEKKEKKGDILSLKLDKDKKINYVKIKLLSSQDFYIPRFRKNWKLFQCCSVERNYTRSAMIIHIHGGGFVAMSSSSHENYLRKWCNKLEVPVISIDYGLAPENPYPKPLDDVWQAYNWILENAADEFQIDLNKIILIGDSAGGNLALSLVYLLILHNKRLPDALFLAYPALRVNDDYYSSSYLLSLNDVVLSYQLLKFCLQSYKKDYSAIDDFLLSPILAPDVLLQMLPPVRIFIGSSDPLRDDSMHLLERLSSLEKDVKLFEFKYFPHGFLSYDLPLMLPEASVANDLIIEEIEKFLSDY